MSDDFVLSSRAYRELLVQLRDAEKYGKDADKELTTLRDRLQAVEKSHTALRLASEELIACVRHGGQEDIGEAMAKVEAIPQPAQKDPQ